MVDELAAPGAELAEKGPDFERRIDEPADPRRAAVLELAAEDLHIARDDLGPNTVTFIAKGDPIPPELAGLPRRSTRAAPRKR
jgi:hypothetical protein